MCFGNKRYRTHIPTQIVTFLEFRDAVEVRQRKGFLKFQILSPCHSAKMIIQDDAHLEWRINGYKSCDQFTSV